MIIINPGTELIGEATEENAISNMKHFALDLGKDIEIIRYEKEDYGDGRYCFIIKENNFCYEIQMPGLPLNQVRYMQNKGQNVFDFPRLYVDGSSWLWFIALSICNFKNEEEGE